jgi:hypothetical protein
MAGKHRGFAATKSAGSDAMKLRLILCLSMALNLALIGGVVSRWGANPAPLTKEESTAPVAGERTNVEVLPGQTVVRTAWAEFRWSDVMTNDLKIYRDNLLGVGCPRPTVRDIIMGEINENFAQRRQSLIAGVQSRFWDCVLRGGEMAVRKEAVGPFLDLKAERQKMISELLGGGFELPDADGQNQQADFQRRFSWLSPEKQSRLFAAEGKRLQELRELAKTTGELPDGQLSYEESRRLQAIRKESAARDDLLTPDEQEESRLRQSNESLWAADMSDFQASEQEWKTVTKLRMEAEDSRNGILYSDLSDEERRSAAEKVDAALTEALKDALGPERYAEYARANDEQFQGIYKVTQRYGLAENVAVQAYDAQQSAAAQAEKIRNDASLSPEQRQQALIILQKNTQQTLSTTLGEKVFSTYNEYSGDWLDKLGRNGNE